MDDGVAECARSWVRRVVVGRVCDDVDPTVFAAEGAGAEADRAVGESLTVGGPVGGVAAPAVVDWVSGTASGGGGELSP